MRIFGSTMTRIKEKPDLEKIGINPFTEGLKVRINPKAMDVINKYGDPDHLKFTFERVPYTKVLDQVGGKAKMVELPVRAKELLLHFLYSIETSTDVLWINRQAYMKTYGIKSVNTFKEAVRSLSEALFIYPHASIKDLYWINPHYFFKGSRISKYPNNVRP